jgi:hypothetical protein
MRASTIFIITLFTCFRLPAQEFNLGLHLNPTLTIPFTNNSTHNDGIKTSVLKPNFNTGINFNLRYKKVSLEIAANFEQKTLYFKQTLMNNTYGGEAFYHIKFTNTSFEFPLLFGYNLYSKKNKTFYIQGGGSAEMTRVSNASQSSGSNGFADMTVYPAYFHNTDSRTVLNAVIGFKIMAKTKKSRVFEYGINYHYPLKSSGHYLLYTTAISSLGNQYIYQGDYEPRLSFVDLKLCYYFLYFDNHIKRIRQHPLRG